MKKYKPETRTKRIFKRIGKTVGFALLYLFIAIGTAVGVLFLSPSGGGDDGTVEIPEALTKILSNFEFVKALDVDLDVDVETPTDNFNVVVDARLDLAGGFSDLKAEGLIVITTGGQNVDINFNYGNGEIFVDALNGKFKLETNSLVSSISQITSLLNVEMPSLGGLDLSSLDVTALLGMLSDLEEEVGSESITIVINVPIIGKLEIVCNLDYSVKAVYLPKAVISEGTAIALSTALSYPSQVVIAKPAQEEYIDATKMINLAGMAIETISQDELGFDLSLDLGQYAIDGNFNTNLKTLSTSFETSVFDLPLKLAHLNNVFYLEYGNINLKFDLADADKLADFLDRQFGISVPVNEIADILAALKAGNLISVLPGLLAGSEPTDISSIDLSVLERFEKVDNNFIISLRDIGEITINAADDKLNSIALSIKGVYAKIDFKEPKPITISKASHADVAKVIPAVEALLNTAKYDNFSGSVKITAGEEEYPVLNFALSKANKNMLAQIKATIFGQNVQLDYQNGNIFVAFKDLLIYGNESDLEYIQALFGMQMPEFGMPQLIPFIQEILNAKMEFVALHDDDNKLVITLLDKYTLTLNYVDVLEGAVVEFEDFKVEIDLTCPDKLDLPTLNTANYTSISEIADKANALYQYITAGTYYVSVSAEYEDITLAGVVNYDKDGLEAQFTLAAYKQEILIRVFGKMIYLDYKDLHLMFNAADYKKLLETIENEFGLDVEEILDKLTSESKTPNLEDILTNLMLGYNKGVLSASYNGVDLLVNFIGDNLKSVHLEYAGAGATITVATSKGHVAPLGEENEEGEKIVYTPIGDVFEKAGWLLDYINGGKYYVGFEFDYSGITANGFVNYDEDGISVFAYASYNDVSFQARFVDNIIYLDIANLKIKFSLDNIDTVLTFLKNEFGVDLTGLYNELHEQLSNITSSDKTNNDLSVKLVGDKLQIISGDTITEIDLAEILNSLSLKLVNNQLQIGYGDITAYINFNDKALDNVNVWYGEDLYAFAQVQGKGEIEFEGEYFDIIEIIPFITSVKNYFLGKQYNMYAKAATVYEGYQAIYQAGERYGEKGTLIPGITLQADLTGDLQFYADAHVAGVKDTKSDGFDLNLNAGLYDDYLYFNYNGLKLKISTENIQGILALVMQLFNSNKLDVSDSTNQLDVDDGTTTAPSIDLSFIDKLLPGIDLNNPLSMLNAFNSISVSDNTLTLNLNGKLMTSNPNANEMQVQIILGDKVVDGKNEKVLRELVIKNLYTGVTDDEHFDLDVEFRDYTGITAPDTSLNYIDLTGAEGLIEAALNTIIGHTAFEISATVNVALGKIYDKDIPLNIRIQMVDGKPEIMARVGAIPVITGVNNDTPWTLPTIKDRMLYIYYKDGYVYFYRSESRSRGDTYEKALKAHIETVMDDVIYYVQWGTGLSNSIVKEIRDSIDKYKGYKPNLGEIIKSFTPAGNGNDYYTIALNMDKIIGNPQLGVMTIGLGLTQHQETEIDENGTEVVVNKNILGKAKFSFEMPLASLVTLRMTSNDISLDTIGDSVDLVYDTGYSYDYFIDEYAKVSGDRNLENIAYDAENGNWRKSAEREFTVEFDLNELTGTIATPATVKGKIGTTFELPYYEGQYSVGEKVIGKDYTVYTFDGWYEDSTFTSPFTDGVIQRHSVTLYAKWIRVEAWRTISFEVDGQIITRYLKADDELPSGIAHQNKGELKDNKLTIWEFVCWKDELDAEVNSVPRESVTLHAVYRTYTITFDIGYGYNLPDNTVFNGKTLADFIGNYGSTAQVVNDGKGTTTTYEFIGWFYEDSFENNLNNKLPTEDVTVYANWDPKSVVKEYILRIYDNGELVGRKGWEEGTSVTLDVIRDTVANAVESEAESVLADYTLLINGDTLWYDNAVYDGQALTLPLTLVDGDIELHIRNKYHVTYTYYEKVNGVHTEKTLDTDVYQGNTFTLIAIDNYLIDYQENGHNSYRINYNFDGYTIEGVKYAAGTSVVMPNYPLTFSVNMETPRTEYYEVTFILKAYIVTGYTYAEFKTAPTPIDPEWILDGTTLDLKQSKYQVTCVMYTGAAKLVTHRFKSTTWGESAWKDFTSGNSGFTSIKITKPTTLYACWKKDD